MLLVIAAFLIVIAIVMGPYWLLVVWPEGTEERALRRRLRGQRAAAAPRIVKSSERTSAIELLDAALRRWDRGAAVIERVLDGSGLRWTPGSVVLASALMAVVTFGLASWISLSAPLALALGVVAAMLPMVYIRRTAGKRLMVFEEQFPEAIDLIARGLRAGHALTTTLQMAGDEIPDPVGIEFRLLYDQQNYGMSLPDALKAFALRVPIIDARFFVTALLTQREMGGNLSEVLDNLATVIRERFKVKRQVKVVSAHGRITGVVLGLLPPIMAVALSLLSPSIMRLLIDDPLGHQMIAVGVALQIIGVIAIRRIVNVEY